MDEYEDFFELTEMPFVAAREYEPETLEK